MERGREQGTAISAEHQNQTAEIIVSKNNREVKIGIKSLARNNQKSRALAH